MTERRLCRTGGIFLLVCLAFAAAGPAAAQTAAISEKNPAGQQPDFTLDEAVQLALRQNPDILRAKQEIERTRGLVIEVRARALPQVMATSIYSQQDENLLEGSSGRGGGAESDQEAEPLEVELPPDPSNPNADPVVVEVPVPERTDGDQDADNIFLVQDKSWRVAVEVRQVIYSGGQVSAALKIARFEQDSSYFRLLETINTVIADVRKQFYLVLVNRALIDVQEESVELLEGELADQQNRFEAGTVARFNVLRAEVELANVRPNLIRARNEYLIARLRLAKQLGIETEMGEDGALAPVNVAGRLEVNRRPVELGPALLAAKAQRAFLKSQRQMILIEAERIKLALSGYKPRVSASGGYEMRNSRQSDDLGDTVNGWFFGVQGSWAVFDGFETHGKVKQARARLESARVNYEDSVLQVELEVQEAYARVQEARELVRSQTKNVEHALEALRLARERLGAGVGTQLDLLDARVALTRARTTELEARFDYNSAMADFEKATGDVTVYDVAFDDPLMKVYKGRR